jgi:chorismate synthase
VAKCILREHHISISSETAMLGKTNIESDSAGAKITCTIHNLPAGLGEPVYDKFHARLGYAILSINGCRGFEIGKGFEAATMCGSEYNDLQNPDYTFKTNHDGGVQGGITNGENVCFSAVFKPIPSIAIPQECLDFEGNPVLYTSLNRNDKSVYPRVLPVIEAMAAMVILDFLLIAKR